MLLNYINISRKKWFNRPVPAILFSQAQYATNQDLPEACLSELLPKWLLRRGSAARQNALFPDAFGEAKDLCRPKPGSWSGRPASNGKWICHRRTGSSPTPVGPRPPGCPFPGGSRPAPSQERSAGYRGLSRQAPHHTEHLPQRSFVNTRRHAHRQAAGDDFDHREKSARRCNAVSGRDSRVGSHY